MTQSASSQIESVLHENRRFPPPNQKNNPEQWFLSSEQEYQELYALSLSDPDRFYREQTSELHFFEPWSKACEFRAPDAKWFVGGKTNLCFNAVDRHVLSGHGDELALIWEEEGNGDHSPKVKHFTYTEVLEEVSTIANMLLSLDVKRGDVVTLYMGMVPELAFAVLACARIGAPHSVIFGGFSASAIADRISDASSKIILTADGLFRRGKVVPLKDNVDKARTLLRDQSSHSLQHCVVLKRTGEEVTMDESDYWWHEVAARNDTSHEAVPLDSEDISFLLYTSGSTGKPKGIVHTTAGYMVHTYLTSKYVFNLRPGGDQVYWCTADIGWITGHSYILYGVMANRIPTLMYEGAPNFPDVDRFWEMVERHRVTHFYTAPTAIRAFMKWGEEAPKKHDLSSLRVLGTVGEPINPESWVWYHQVIGGGRCPIVDTYWQTETGGHMLTPLPGVTENKPGSCAKPFFGVDAAVVNSEGKEITEGGGLLVIKKPWPSMLRGVHGDRQRFIDTYWSTVKIDGSPVYFAGDGARRDADGFFWIMGRVDDVINVSGHRLGTMEIESALVSSPSVVEAAVVGMPHDIKGTGITAFVTLAQGVNPGDAASAEALRQKLREHVSEQIGAIAKPDVIRFTDALPKTRSGKIMRRLLREIAEGKTEVSGDTSTLEDFTVLAKLGDET